MDRQIVYAGQILPETTLLKITQDVMVGLGKLAAATLGTSTLINGFAVTPTAPASLQVNAAAGEVYSLQNLEASQFSTLLADTSHQIVKQGIALDPTTITLAAPTTAGYAVNYLIEVGYQDTDSNASVLPYYNSANPAQPFSGPNNTATQQYTSRKGSAVVQAKAGVAATTGTQTTPAPDAGYAGAYVVTVAYGQTQITAANISVYTGAPFIGETLTQKAGQTEFQQDLYTAATAGGTADALTATFSPAFTAATLSAGCPTVTVRAASANATTTPTFTPAPGVISPAVIVKGAGQALAVGDIAGAGHWVTLQWDATLAKWVLLNPATGISGGAGSGLIGQSSNLRAYLSAAGTSLVITADEVIVETAIGGTTYRLSGINQTFNGATVGANGMDVGSLPTSGFVAVYEIYNPSTGTKALLGANATSAAPAVYGGANMPSGFTASALVAVWPTNSSAQLISGGFIGRTFYRVATLLFSVSASAPSFTSVSLAAAVPANAKSISGYANAGSSSTSSDVMMLQLSPDANGVGAQAVGFGGTSVSGRNIEGVFSGLPLFTAQTLYYTDTSTSGTPNASVYLTSYTI